MQLSPDPNWYVVHTRSRAEKAVAANLARRGIETFLPTVTRRSRWQDRYKAMEVPLFPGYCFTHIRPVERLKVVSCPLVVGLLTSNGQPVPVELAEIESIRALVMSNLACEPCQSLNEGDRVIVRYGPLKGVVGRLVRRGRRSRLELSVAALARAVSVEVEATDVEKY